MDKSERQGAYRTPPKIRLRTQLSLGIYFGLVQAAILYAASGQADWLMGWLTIGIHWAIYALVSLFVPVDEGLAEERTRIKENVPAWDQWIATVGSIIYPLGLVIAAGLDRRFGWSPEMALWLHLLGLVGIVAGTVFGGWAAATNRFYGRYVRIQNDRGHHVIDTGPYAWVRHPGYVGIVVAMFGIVLAFGSLAALALAAALTPVLVIRTALEDRFLQANLEGYAAYAQRVRYRLLPGIW